MAQILFLIQGKITLFTMGSICFGGSLIALFLYWLNILAPGDAKLLLGIFLALPPSLFQDAAGKVLFPPIVVAINVLAVYFLGISLYMLIKSSTAQKQQAILTSLNGEKLSQSIANFFRFFALGVIVSAVWNRFPFLTALQLGGFFRMAVVLVLFSLLKKFAFQSKHREFLSILLFASAATLMLIAPPSWETLVKSLLLYLAIYLLIITFLLNLAHLMFIKEVKIDDLKVGMVPAETILEIQEGSHFLSYMKSDSKALDEPVDQKANLIGGSTLNPLGEEDIQILKQLAESGHFLSFGNSLRVQETMWFAPVILAGVIITIISKGPFYLKISPLIGTLSRWIG